MMSRLMYRNLFFCGVAAFIGIGCSHTSAGVESSKQLSELNSDEVQKLCEWYAEKLSNPKKCHLMGSKPSLVSQCKSNAAKAKKSKTCEASVEDFQECVSVIYDTDPAQCETAGRESACEAVKDC